MKALAALALLSIAAPVAAQEAGEAPLAPGTSSDSAITRPRQPPGMALPLTPTRRIAFDTDEGTWLSLDISPDGRRILFDMLGDLYAIDARGGEAKAIARGLAFETQPTFSPDGSLIAYVSDRSGAENLWIAKPDGSGARQISFGDDDTVLVSPAWSADGKALFVSRYRPSLNAYELWRYGLDGSETPLIPARPAPDADRGQWRSSLGAVASCDGRSLYFARHVGPLDFETVDEWTIVRRDLASGAEETIVTEPDGPRKALNPGAAFRPALSPDGRLLAYAARRENRTELRLRDLATGADHRLVDGIEHDQLQASMWQDIEPRYAFTPDGKGIMIARDGKLARIDIASGAITPIPFTAHVDMPLGPLTRVAVPDETGPVRARLIQTPEQSPDGKTLAFSALGHVYLMPLDGKSAPHRLTALASGEYHPGWSPDGRSLVFVSWGEKEGGALWIAPADGSAPPRRITQSGDYYTRPVFTPDGGTILAIRSPQRDRLRLYMEYGNLRAGSLVAMPAAGGTERTILSGTIGGRPQFGPEPGTVWLQFAQGLVPVALASGAKEPPITIVGPGWYFQDGPQRVDDVAISPDGKWALAQVAQQLHLIELPATPRVIDLEHPGVRHRRITAIGADYFGWADGGRTISWAVGDHYQRRALSSVPLDPADRPGWTPAPATGTMSFEAVVELPRDIPGGSILLRGARVITMRGDETIEGADILVTGNRIAAIGPRGSIAVPPGAAIREVAGKTIIPGLIDVHDHIATIRRDVLAMGDWGLRARLASGVTTSFDPSTLSVDMFAYQDMLDAGLILGPRLPSTGTALFSFNRFASEADAEAVETRYRDEYRTRNLKEYRVGSRRQREYVIMAAKRLGMMPTTEGALSFKLDLSQIIDGYSGNEHSLATPLHRDVIELLARSRTSYDTTLQITNGGAPAQDWFLADESPLGDPKLHRFWPGVFADQMTLHRDWRPLSEYAFPKMADGAAKVARAGGVVAMGSHGETPGFGLHWEMEAHVMGGMTPMEALHATTVGGAETIGRSAQIGTLVPGKYADLLILNADPRADIRAAADIAQVMKNGRLYDAATLDEVWPEAKPLETPWFAGEQQGENR